MRSYFRNLIIAGLLAIGLAGSVVANRYAYRRGYHEGSHEEGISYYTGVKLSCFLEGPDLVISEIGGSTYLVRPDVLDLRRLHLSPKFFSSMPELSPGPRINGYVRVVSSQERNWKDPQYRGHAYKVEGDRLVEVKE